MTSNTMVHKDNEPLLPLMEPNSGHQASPSKQQYQNLKFNNNQPKDDDIKPSKLSESTVHDSTSSSVAGPEDRDHPLFPKHKDETRLSISNDYDYDCRSSISDDDNDALLEARRDSARDKRRLMTAIGLCGTFFIIELVGAMWSGSLALLSDSFHLMTDITSFVISLTAIFLSQRPSTAKYTYGYYRAEVLGALISIFLIWGLTLMLVVEAIGRLRHPIDVDGKTMSAVAAVGVCVNISLMFVLGGNTQPDDDFESGSARSNNHEHEPLRSDDDLDQDTLVSEQKSAPAHDDEQGPKQRHVNLNMTAATLHVLGDLLSSIGVLTSSLIITFYPSLTFLDPVCTFVFSIMVVATTVGVFKRSICILMERVPQGIDSDEIKDAVCDIPGVLEVKSLHVWSLTTGKAALAGTVYLQPEIKDLRRAAAIVSKSREMIKKQYGIKECTIQVAMYSLHAQSLSQQRRFESSSTKTALSKNGHHIDALARHDRDVVFSIGDDDFDEMINPASHRLGSGLAHSQFLSQDITRAETRLSMYHKNRNASDDEDESETEMETEIDLAVPLQIKPSQWA